MPDVHLQERYGLFIGGEWRDAADGATFTTKCPANGEPLAACAQATREDVDDAEKAAMAAAQKAHLEQMVKAREKAFDKDGDGKLNDDERKAMLATMQKRRPNAGANMQEMVKRFDKDGDGKLNETERQAMMQEMQKNRPEIAARMQEMVKRFDKDGDGKLNDEERKAMLEERAKHRPQAKLVEPPPPPAAAPAATTPAK